MVTVPIAGDRVALVDAADAAAVIAAGPWHIKRGRTTDYAQHSVSDRRKITMHGLITGWPYVDHINGDGLDNRRSNLRQATHAQNCANRGPTRANALGLKGVGLLPSGRWRAQIRSSGHQRHVGVYATADEAARAYDAAATEAFGEFARLNFPTTEVT